MPETLKCISPVDGSVYAERALHTGEQIQRALQNAQQAHNQWRNISLAERQQILNKAVDLFVAGKTEIAEELSWQMGRPVSQTPGEVAGFEERARYMIEIAPEALAKIKTNSKQGFTRFIQRDPLGVVFVIAPWNYPYLTSVNAIVPALMAGNAVLLKHSAQTPLCSERYSEVFKGAGLPPGLFQHLHLNHTDTLNLISESGVDFVNFTGSVPGGHAVQQAAAQRFIGVGLELGGKDPAYVRHDANLNHAVENLADGAFFNSGQSCCGIERIYAHKSIYDDFVDGLVEFTNKYQLGNPLQDGTNLGPMVRISAAEFVREQIREACKAGGKALIDETTFAANQSGSPYLAPQIMVNVDHDMKIMSEESFGPVVGVMKVESDEHAIELMNDSDFGLTAAIWTEDEQAAIELGRRVNTGTWFMNRCDYLDPALAWTGVKNSGYGCSLSVIGYEQLTRPKSFHLRINTQ